VKMKNQEGNQQSAFLVAVRCFSVKARYIYIHINLCCWTAQAW
jgi:hypothetical protein